VQLDKKKVAILLEDLFEESEFLYPFYRLQEAGAQVIVVGAGEARSYTSKHGLVIPVDKPARELNPADVAAVIVPGGYAPDRMRRHPEMLALVRALFEQGKPVALICHGPWVAISAGIVKGKRMTSFYAIRDDVLNAGAQWVDEPVVVDGNLISARGPADLPAFGAAIVRALGLR
jgi:protease I